jgi:2-polyprenyl-3-methyl-5-hydroxy-6-metoxy-1,4-benzoquinol methylase
VRPLPEDASDPLWVAARTWDNLEVWRHRLPRRSLGYVYAYQARHDATLAALRAACPPPARVLEIGAGGGNFTLPLAEDGYRVVWNDLRAELVALVQAKWERGQVEYQPGNLFDLAADALGPVDAILATEVIEHCAHPDRFLRHLAGLLPPGGALVLTTPLGSYCRNTLPRFSDFPNPEIFEDRQYLPDADGHIFLLHEDELRSLAAAAGLEVERVETLVNPLTHGHVKLGLLLPLLPRALVAAAERWSRRWPASLTRRLHSTLLAVLRRPPSGGA